MKNLYYLIPLLIFYTACKKPVAQQMQIVYNDSIKVQPLDYKAAIVMDSIILSKQSENVQSFYALNDNKSAWFDKDNRAQLIQIINDNYKEGIIQNKNLQIDSLKYYHANYADLDDQAKTRADILFSKSFVLNANNFFNGVLNPKRLSKDWDLDRKELNAEATMLLALDNRAIVTTFDSLRPVHKEYTYLKQKLEDLYHLQKDTLHPITQNVNVNDTVQGIETIKKHLSFLSLYADSLKIDNVYDQGLETTVKQLQTAKKLPVSNKLDVNLIKAIDNEENRIKEKLIVNLERWRWFPRTFGDHYILVNIAGFNLVTVSNKDTIKEHKVIVGTTARKTPILTSTLTNISMNPTWTVPPTILKNDMAPKAATDSTYFGKRNFTIYDKSTGKAVDPKEWNADKYGSYRYVQKGGPGNTLGRIKFMFNNNHAVYLHDTPNHAYFNRENRNMSSGCVRVQDPFDLAEFIFQVQENDISKEKVDEIIKSHKTTNFKVSEIPVHVHQLYWTIQVDKKGNIKEYRDVYNFDSDLYKKLQ
ncbi:MULTISPECIES: murein L,D-transpeptidase [Myroides]|uniref:L,D-transpeptidase family protein n=1 Tax=Myroides albus TaxID=2562892 RepID=A0A6I3LL84_9FLAO|nr:MULTISPECIES: L,D-transpeptidase family protein [Myroides]MTG96932.1 L,D-transpeptidase family protein [Myroides albus]MVX35375.1 L,D-transpeptidase family protein [Myroides sp. LoEW2-1]UVD78317.1 L,D-transpeptidase family protein [Myroides albus]